MLRVISWNECYRPKYRADTERLCSVLGVAGAGVQSSAVRQATGAWDWISWRWRYDRPDVVRRPRSSSTNDEEVPINSPMSRTPCMGPDSQNILYDLSYDYRNFIVPESLEYCNSLRNLILQYTLRSSYVLRRAKDSSQESRKLICEYCLRRAYNFASESYPRRSIVIKPLS